MSSKLRVYEVARDLGMDNKELVTLLQSIGFSEIKNHMSVVPSEAIDRAKRQLERKNEPNKVVEERIRPTVVKRRTAAKRPEEGAPGESTPAIVAAPPVVRDAVRAPLVPVTVTEGSKGAPATTQTVEATKSAEKTTEGESVAKAKLEPFAEVAIKAEGTKPDVVAETPKSKVEVGDTPKADTSTVTPTTSVGTAAPVVAKSETKIESKVETSTPKETEPKVPEAPKPSSEGVEAKPAEQKPSEHQAVVESVTAEKEIASGDKPVAPAAAAEKPNAPVEPAPGAIASADIASDVAREPKPAAPGEARAPTPIARPAARPGVTTHAAGTQPGATRSAAPTPGTRPSTPPGAARPSSPPRTGIEVWEGRPGVPMSPAHRAPVPRRVQYDAKAGANAAQRRPGQPMQRMGRGMRGGRNAGGMGGSAGGMGRGAPMSGRGSNAPPATQERGAHKRVVKIEGSVGLQTLANSMGVKAHELLRKLIMLGMTGVNINSTLDADTAKIVATEFGWDVADVAVSEEQALVIAQGVETEADTGEREPRPPVVTVMGHVDHGKTSLLDRIRKANVVAGEAGGITQHIGAYSVETARGRITFLDTPGHEAFTSMRMRGAQTTDIVILVVAADDGVMPQTKEAVNHAKSAKVPIVVAINKCDKPEAQPDRCRRELAELGLVPEEWGGDTLFTEVSAHTGKGIDGLLERVLLQAEMLDLRANPNKLASGVVIEAQLDRGRGPVATMLVTDGTLKRGDILLVGAACGKVRAMLDSAGRSLNEAGPATPVEVIGLDSVPAAGDPVHVIKDLKTAQELADSRKIKERRSLMPSGGQRLTLEELYKAMKETEQLELKVIVKADVHGSVEAVSDALMRLSTDKVKVTVVHAAAGAITEGDVNLAVAAGSIIIGFNVRPAGKAASLAAQEKVEVRQYNIIYNVVDDVKAAMEGLLSPSLVEKVLGQAQVRQVFRVSKAGNVAGCMVTQGVIRRAAGIRVMREAAMIWSGKLSALKRFKDDAREVKEGFDCGISLEGYQDIKEGDVLECFEMEEVRQTL